jgi:hypothetical protein
MRYAKQKYSVTPKRKREFVPKKTKRDCARVCGVIVQKERLYAAVCYSGGEKEGAKKANSGI